MGEVLFIIGLIGGLVGWPLLLKGKARIFWFITMAIIGATVGVMEIIGTVAEGATISQMFWAWSVTHVWQAYVCMGMLLSSIIILIIHLMWKIWTNKDYKKTLKSDEKKEIK